MELKSKGIYHNAFGSLYEDETTEGRDFPEEVKAKMLEDFPELFEVVVEEASPPKTKK